MDERQGLKMRNGSRLVSLLFAISALILVSVPSSIAALPSPELAAQAGVLDEVPTNQIIIKYKAFADLSGVNAPSHPARMRALSAVAGVRLEYFREMSGDAHVLRLPSRLPVSEVRQIGRASCRERV